MNYLHGAIPPEERNTSWATTVYKACIWYISASITTQAYCTVYVVQHHNILIFFVFVDKVNKSWRMCGDWRATLLAEGHKISQFCSVITELASPQAYGIPIIGIYLKMMTRNLTWHTIQMYNGMIYAIYIVHFLSNTKYEQWIIGGGGAWMIITRFFLDPFYTDWGTAKYFNFQLLN